eukprot:TRINITY_DN3372_c0_g2_i1.p1 TRINITY_DN3372_c0_g2~~TRINITY_DN3372_c0_g2_i1.p1  ORF type:complete len:145 (+),score=55.39 TRINITY_DN3372_c0_g2_i1:428-862(+)
MKGTTEVQVERSKIYDFEGDELVNNLDSAAQECLPFVRNNTAILQVVQGLFSESNYTHFQAYGIYDGLDMKCGVMAEQMLKDPFGVDRKKKAPVARGESEAIESKPEAATSEPPSKRPRRSAAISASHKLEAIDVEDDDEDFVL